MRPATATIPARFESLMRILDAETRLLTPHRSRGHRRGLRWRSGPIGHDAARGSEVLSAHPRLPGAVDSRVAGAPAAGDPAGPGRVEAGGAGVALGREAGAQATPLAAGMGVDPGVHRSRVVVGPAARDDAGGGAEPPGPRWPCPAGRGRARRGPAVRPREDRRGPSSGAGPWPGAPAARRRQREGPFHRRRAGEIPPMGRPRAETGGGGPVDRGPFRAGTPGWRCSRWTRARLRPCSGRCWRPSPTSSAIVRDAL